MTTYASAQFKPGVRDQIKIGQQAAAEIRKKETILPSSDPRVKLVRRVGEELVAQISDETMKKRPFQYTFDVIRNDQVNAFALPGGPIFVYSGLIDKLKTVDELAGIMGHELVHVRDEHWAVAYNEYQKKQLGFSILSILIRPNKTIGNIASIGLELMNLGYSRTQESRSDRGGFKLMTDAGYNPQGLVDVFKMFESVKKGGQPPEFLSTHPSDQARIRSLEELVEKDSRKFAPLQPLPFRTSAIDKISRKSK